MGGPPLGIICMRDSSLHDYYYGLVLLLKLFYEGNGLDDYNRCYGPAEVLLASIDSWLNAYIGARRTS